MGAQTSRTAENVEEFESFLQSEKLAKATHDKLLDMYKDYKQSFTELKKEHDCLKVNTDQKIFELESRVKSGEESVHTEASIKQANNEQIKKLEKRLAESSKKLQELQCNLDESSRARNEFERKAQLLEAEKSELSSVLQSKEKDMQRMQSDWKAQSEELSKANTLRISALAQLNEAESLKLTAEQKEVRVVKEKQQLEKQNAWLEDQLQTKVNELLGLRREQLKKTMDLESALNTKTEELGRVQSLLDTMTETQEQKDAKLETYMQKLKEAKDLQAEMEEQYGNEIHAQAKLVELYKSSYSEQKNKVEEMMAALEEVKKLLQESTDAHEAVEKQREEDCLKYESEIKLQAESINELRTELSHANELLSEARSKGLAAPTDAMIEEMSPSAAATSRLLKSGMTLTQIYSEYVKTCEELALQKDENARLASNLSSIMKDIQEHAPLMAKQRDDYEKSLKTVELLTNQLDTARIRCEKLQISSDDNERKCGIHKREADRFKRETVDLGLQVRYLLKELHEARGTVVTTGYRDDDSVMSKHSESESQQIITDNLVTFKSIEELQAQNQKLIQVLRDVSEEKEAAEAVASKQESRELQAKLDIASKELEHMKESRERQAKMVEAIVKQRDQYKMMLADLSTTQQDMSFTGANVSTTSTSTSPVKLSGEKFMSNEDMEKLTKTSEKLAEVQQDFLEYKREKEANHKILDEHVEKFRKEASEHRLLSAKLTSQLEFAEERNKVIQANIAGFKKEVASLREKNDQYSQSIVKHETSLTMLREEVKQLQQKLQLATIQSENWRRENQRLAASESRLMQENQSLMDGNQSQQLVLANLQSIQNNLEQSDRVTEARFQHRIQELERENSSLKRKLEGTDTQNRQALSVLQRELVEMRNKASRADEQAQMSDSKAAKASEESEALKEQLQTLQSQVLDLQEQLKNTSVSSNKDQGHDEAVKHLHAQIEANMLDINSLTERLQIATEQAKQYEEVSSTMEQTLKTQKETAEQYRKSMEEALTEANDARITAEKKLTALLAEKQKLVEENAVLCEQNRGETSNYSAELSKLTAELSEVKDLLAAATQRETQAREDLREQSALAEQAQNNYQRELVLHASDVKLLEELREQASTLQRKLESLEKAASESKMELKLQQESWSEHEKHYNTKAEAEKQRLKNLQDQNQLLHQQLEQLSDQMRKIEDSKDQHNVSFSEKNLDALEEGEQSTAQLLEVIKYLRKEKQISETRVEILEAENTRSKQQIKAYRTQVNDANAQLQQAQSMQSEMHTATEYTALMSKVEQLSILSESNKLLRDERNTLANSVQSLEGKVKDLEDILVPTKKDLKEVCSERDMLNNEKTALLAAVERWKERTEHLVEKCNKIDPDEQKRLIAERDMLKEKCTANESDIQNHKEKIAQLNNDLTKSAAEIAAAKAEVETVKQEVSRLEEQVKEKEKALGEQAATMNQLRTIGRKYRTEATTKQTELNEVKGKLEKLEGLQKSVDQLKAAESNIQKLQAELGTAQKEITEMKSSLEASDSKLKELEAKLTEKTKECAKQQQLVDGLKTSSSETEQKLQQAQEEVVSLKSELEKEKQEIVAKSKKVEVTMKRVKVSIANDKKKIQALEQTVQSLQSRADGAGTTAGQASTEEVNKLKKENAELLQKVQKLMETQQANKPSVSTERPSVSEAPRANIRPMASPTISARQMHHGAPRHAGPHHGAPHTHHGATHPHQQQVARTVAIRPMAVPPQQRTATVMPTTHEGESTQPSTSQVRPTQTVQPVSPVVEDTSVTVATTSNVQQQDVVSVYSDDEGEPLADAAVIPSSSAAISSTASSTVLSISTTSGAGTSSSGGVAVATTAIQPPTATMRSATSITSSTGISVPHSSVVGTTSSTTTSPSISSTGATSAASGTIGHMAYPQPSTSSGAASRTNKRPIEETEMSSEDDAVTSRKRGHMEPSSDQATHSDSTDQIIPNASDNSSDAPGIETDGHRDIALVEPSHPTASAIVKPSAMLVDPVPEVVDIDDDDDDGDGSGAGDNDVDDEAGGVDIGGDSSQVPSSGDDVTAPPHHHPAADENDDDDDDAVIFVPDAPEGEFDTEPEYPDRDDDISGSHTSRRGVTAACDRTNISVTSAGQSASNITVERSTEQEVIDNDQEMTVYDQDTHAQQIPVSSVSGEEDGGFDVPSTSTDNDSSLVVIDEELGSSSNQGVESSQGSVIRPSTSQSAGSSRLAQVSHSQQLTPFMLGSQASAFEEGGDEGIVPSTPTLYLPRRNEGFAEVVSSPHVSSRSFVFAAGNADRSDMVQLSAQAGVDDTHVDLLFDDSGVRSIPTTPRSHTPPSITVTDASSGPAASSTGPAGSQPGAQQSHSSETSTPAAAAAKPHGSSATLTSVISSAASLSSVTSTTGLPSSGVLSSTGTLPLALAGVSGTVQRAQAASQESVPQQVIPAEITLHTPHNISGADSMKHDDDASLPSHSLEGDSDSLSGVGGSVDVEADSSTTSAVAPPATQTQPLPAATVSGGSASAGSVGATSSSNTAPPTTSSNIQEPSTSSTPSTRPQIQPIVWSEPADSMPAASSSSGSSRYVSWGSGSSSGATSSTVTIRGNLARRSRGARGGAGSSGSQRGGPRVARTTSGARTSRGMRGGRGSNMQNKY